MNSTELKSRIIKQIDSLNDEDCEKVYNQLLEILNSANHYKLSEEENDAIDLAIKVSD